MDTLEEICQNGRRELGTRPIVAMDAPFFDYLHNRAPQDVVTDGSKDAYGGDQPQLLFHDLLKHWTRVATTVRPPPSQICRIPMQMTKSVVINGNDPGFPGPLCCPLTKANGLSMVAQESDNYWVTEKSDGIRVVFVSILSPQFPRWRMILRRSLVPAQAQEEGEQQQLQQHQPRLLDLCLADIITVESGFTELRMHSLLQESSQLRLTIGTHILRKTDRPDIFALVLRTADVNAPEQSVMVHRMLCPRHFSYVFDRSMTNSYLLTEEYPLTQLSSVILDTELVLAKKAPVSVAEGNTTTATKRLFLAAFDMYAFESVAPGNPCDVWLQQTAQGKQKQIASSSLGGVVERFLSSSQLRRLDRDSMTTRLELMQREVFDPLHKVFQSQLTPFLPLVTVPIVLKRMVKVAEMRSLFPFLSARSVVNPHQTSTKHPISTTLYEFSEYPFGVTHNDGFIFTPDQFDLISGSQPRQLKWKWPDKLTVDWLVKPARSNRTAPVAAGTAATQQQQQQQPVGLFDVSLYFKKKRDASTADAGHTQFSRAMVMDNPNGLQVMNNRGGGAALIEDGGVIVESRFDASRGRWIMEKLRNEKTEANSVVTVVSVLESAAENLDLLSLCELLGIEGPSAGSSLLLPNSAALTTTTATTPTAEEAVASSSAPMDASSSSLEKCETESASTAAPSTNGSIPAVPTVKTCKLVVRATQLKFSNEVSLVLQWSVKLPAVRNVITCNHRKIEECFGLGEPCAEIDASSRLKDVMMLALGNGGGSYAWSNMVVDAFFDGNSGRWGIVKLHPTLSSNDAFNTQVLEHLMSIATFHARTGAFPELPEGLNRPNERVELPRDKEAAAWVDALHVETNRHYAERAMMLSHGKQQRSVLRRINNFIKSTLLHNGVDSARTMVGEGNREYGARVLDLCCGRGGDLQKWKNLKPIASLVLVDSCFEAVAEAAARYSVGAGLSTKIVAGRPGYPGIPAKFFVRDCFERCGMQEMFQQIHSSLATTEPSTPSTGLFDVVSCQFSMHYGFSEESRVRAFLANISDALTSGGVFVGTTVDDRRLLELRKKHGDRFGNSVYQVDFTAAATSPPHGINAAATVTSAGEGDPLQQQQQTRSSSSSPVLYGDAYSISVEHSVESQTEYVVHWKNFVQLAASEYDLSLVESLNFIDAFKLYVGTSIGQGVLNSVVKESGGGGGDANEHHQGDQLLAPNGGSGLRRLSNGELTLVLDEEEEEAVSLFRTFVFSKI